MVVCVKADDKMRQEGYGCMASNKTKKPRKQKIKTLKKSPPQIKISEAILKLSDPLRFKYRESHRTEVIISMTVLAWNISLFPKEEQVNVQGMILDALPEKFTAEDIAIFLENIDILIERKNRDYPHIRELIINNQISISGDTITLTVSTTPFPKK